MSLSRDAAAAAQRHSIVTVSGLGVVWESMTGGGMSVDYEVRNLYPGVAVEIDVGAVRAAPIVLTSSLSPYRDLAWLRAMKRQIGVGRFTITRQWTDANWSPVGEPEVYPECVLVGVENPESSPSSDDAEFSLTFAGPGEAL